MLGRESDFRLEAEILDVGVQENLEKNVFGGKLEGKLKKFGMSTIKF